MMVAQLSVMLLNEQIYQIAYAVLVMGGDHAIMGLLFVCTER
jgi:hypothetical protein